MDSHVAASAATYILFKIVVELRRYLATALFLLERRCYAGVYCRGQLVLPVHIGFLLPLNKQTYNAFIPASFATLAVTITSFALAKFVHRNGSSAFMYATVMDIVALNHIGDVRRCALFSNT